MAQITRAIQRIFGSSGGTAEFGVIGSAAADAPQTTKDITTIQSLAQYLQGYFGIVSNTGVAELPYSEDLNSLFFLVTTQLAYLFQNGIPEWLDSADQRYYENISFVQVDGDIYQAIQGNDTDAINSQQNPATATDWWRLIFPQSLVARFRTVTAAETINLLTEPSPRVISVTSGTPFTLTLNNSINRAGEILTISNTSADTLTIDGTAGISQTLAPNTMLTAISNAQVMIALNSFDTASIRVANVTDLNATNLNVTGNFNGTSITTEPVPRFYTGSDVNNLDYPIGSTLFALAPVSPFPDRNEIVTVAFNGATNTFSINVAGGNQLVGTWVVRGGTQFNAQRFDYLVQRVA